MSMVTIEIEEDALKKLEHARASEDESLTEVIRRGKFLESSDKKVKTGGDVLAYWQRLYKEHPESFLDEETLDELDRIQENPWISPSHWDDPEPEPTS